MRKTLEDGHWFDTDTAECWDDNLPDDTDWERAKLYRTQSGNWVLEEGLAEATCKHLDDEEACTWLLQHDHYDAATKHLPDRVKELEL